jgi:hypothetical protein
MAMLDEWRRRRAAARIKEGDGRELYRFRWWHLLTRSRFHLGPWTVDVKHGGEKEDGEVRAYLYLDGRQHAVSKVPAAFPVPGGRIEVAVTLFGLKRCHFVADDGTEQQLTPDPRTAAGWRARLDRRHPALSRWIGVVSIVLVIAGIGLNLVQILGPISQIPPVQELTGTFVPPIKLPLWLNITLGFGAALGSSERALRLRYSWLLDAAA